MLDIEIKDGDVVTPMSNTDFKDNIFSGASRMRAGQGIYGLRQCILNHFRPLLDIFGAKGLFKDTFVPITEIPFVESLCNPKYRVKIRITERITILR